MRDLDNNTLKKQLVVITGKSGSGKTTIKNELVKVGFNQILTKTTRLPRKGEIEGKDYNFLNEDEFVKGEYCLVGKNNNGNQYGIDKNDLFNGENQVLVTGRSGIDDISDMVRNELISINNILIIYLNFSNFTLIRRLLKRGDTKEAIRERLLNDEKKFEGFSTGLEIITITTGNIKEITFSILKGMPI